MVETRYQKRRQEAQKPKNMDFINDDNEIFNQRPLRSQVYTYDDDETLTHGGIKDHMDDPKFNKVLDAMLNQDPHCHFLMLAQ